MRLTVHNHRKSASPPFSSHQLAAFLIFTMSFISRATQAYDLTDRLSVGGVLAGVYQIMDVEADDLEERGGGALSLQPEFSFRLTKRDELFTRLGFAVGNGLNESFPFSLHPWAATLDIDSSQVAEAYARLVLNGYLALTMDIQYIREETVAGGAEGFVFGLRMVLAEL
jgi:hypothetical protein